VISPSAFGYCGLPSHLDFNLGTTNTKKATSRQKNITATINNDCSIFPDANALNDAGTKTNNVVMHITTTNINHNPRALLLTSSLFTFLSPYFDYDSSLSVSQGLSPPAGAGITKNQENRPELNSVRSHTILESFTIHVLGSGQVRHGKAWFGTVLLGSVG